MDKLLTMSSKEMCLSEISSREAGNAYLPEFIEDFNRRFVVQPTSQHDAHRQLTAYPNLAGAPYALQKLDCSV